VSTRRNEEDDGRISLASAMSGILVLLIDEREARIKDEKAAVRIEVLLARAGMSTDEIAEVTGRSRDAVRMAVSRARARGKVPEAS